MSRPKTKGKKSKPTTSNPGTRRVYDKSISRLVKVSKNSHHVVPNIKGGWKIIKSNGKRATKLFVNKKNAVAYAKQLSANQGTNLVVHKKDGSIQHTKEKSKKAKTNHRVKNKRGEDGKE